MMSPPSPVAAPPTEVEIRWPRNEFWKYSLEVRIIRLCGQRLWYHQDWIRASDSQA